MIKANKKQVLIEQYSQLDSSSTFKEYVERESENDPNFFRWLFDKEFEQDFDSSLSSEEKEQYNYFLNEL